ncbi:MAG: hypothetical protein FWG64_07330 [Firmicutes bacterium]|nr:hypothetical protein [Bacillota bacterium]
MKTRIFLTIFCLMAVSVALLIFINTPSYAEDTPARETFAIVVDDVEINHRVITNAGEPPQNTNFTLQRGAIVELEICPICENWQYPEQATLPEELLNRYYFPDLGFSFAIPKVWENFYYVSGLENQFTMSVASSLVVDRNSSENGLPIGNVPWQFEVISNYRTAVLAMGNACLIERAGQSDTFRRYFLAQDDENTYAVQIDHSLIKDILPTFDELPTDISDISVDTFLEMNRLHYFVLNSFRLLVPVG